jgi:hypothetical protein
MTCLLAIFQRAGLVSYNQVIIAKAGSLAISNLVGKRYLQRLRRVLSEC